MPLYSASLTGGLPAAGMVLVGPDWGVVVAIGPPEIGLVTAIGGPSSPLSSLGTMSTCRNDLLQV